MTKKIEEIIKEAKENLDKDKKIIFDYDLDLVKVINKLKDQEVCLYEEFAKNNPDVKTIMLVCNCSKCSVIC